MFFRLTDGAHINVCQESKNRWFWHLICIQITVQNARLLLLHKNYPFLPPCQTLTWAPPVVQKAKLARAGLIPIQSSAVLRDGAAACEDQRHYIHIDLYITPMHGVLMGSPPNVKYKGAESKYVVTLQRLCLLPQFLSPNAAKILNKRMIKLTIISDSAILYFQWPGLSGFISRDLCVYNVFGEDY